MAALRPRKIPLNLDRLPLYVSYSDGEGEGAGVGVAVWLPDDSSVAGFMKLPMEVRHSWSRAKTCGDFYDIYEIEAVGPALILHNFGDVFVDGCLWMHFIDNEAALATLVKGSSAVLAGECITAYTHSMVAKSGMWTWFDRVASDDNPVDKLSRGSLVGPWQLRDIEFPPILLDNLRRYIYG